MEFDNQGNLVNLDGYPILMGDFASEKVVHMDGSVEREVRE